MLPLSPDLFASLPPVARAYIRALEARVAELEARLAQDSSNSSKPPPSSDCPHVSPAPHKTASGRRCGGQPGVATVTTGIVPSKISARVADRRGRQYRG